MNNDIDWEAQLAKTTSLVDYEKRAEEQEAKIARISKDPAPQWAKEEPKPYPTTEKHYIMCSDEEAANESLPDAKNLYGQPHKLGGVLISDRAELPKGWIKTPPRGTPIDVIKDSHPPLYYYLANEKKVTNF